MATFPVSSNLSMRPLIHPPANPCSPREICCTGCFIVLPIIWPAPQLIPIITLRLQLPSLFSHLITHLLPDMSPLNTRHTGGITSQDTTRLAAWQRHCDDETVRNISLITHKTKAVPPSTLQELLSPSLVVAWQGETVSPTLTQIKS